jgi:hypothetical protein
MALEGSLPCSQQPASGPYPEPDESNPHLPTLFPLNPPKSEAVSNIVTRGFLRWRAVSPSLNPQAGGPPHVGCPPLLSQYIRSYPPYLGAVSSIRNTKTSSYSPHTVPRYSQTVSRYPKLVKVKVKVTERIEEWRYSSTHSLTLALYGGEWSALRPGRFTPRERTPDTHWIGGWVGPRAGLDAVVKRKIPSPCRDSKPRSSSP